MRMPRLSRTKTRSCATRFCMSQAAITPFMAPGSVHMISSPMVLMTLPPWLTQTMDKASSTAEMMRRASTSPRCSNSLVLPLTSANRMHSGWVWLMAFDDRGIGLRPSAPGIDPALPRHLLQHAQRHQILVAAQGPLLADQLLEAQHGDGHPLDVQMDDFITHVVESVQRAPHAAE